jgi:hypothetical protein
MCGRNSSGESVLPGAGNTPAMSASVSDVCGPSTRNRTPVGGIVTSSAEVAPFITVCEGVIAQTLPAFSKGSNLLNI